MLSAPRRRVHTVTLALDRLLTDREWTELLKQIRRVPYVHTIQADVVERGAVISPTIRKTTTTPTTTRILSRAGTSHSTADP